ncbi:unnamed protein product, partial [marine sediment metagenome]
VQCKGLTPAVFQRSKNAYVRDIIVLGDFNLLKV